MSSLTTLQEEITNRDSTGAHSQRARRRLRSVPKPHSRLTTRDCHVDFLVDLDFRFTTHDSRLVLVD